MAYWLTSDQIEVTGPASFLC